MSVPTAGDAPLPVLTPRRSRRPLILGIIAAVLFFFVGCSALLFTSSSKAVDGAKVAADAFLSRIEAGDYAAARDLLTAEAREQTDTTTLRDIMGLLEKRRGKAIGHTGPTGYNVRSFDGVTTVELGYQAAFAKNETLVRLTLRREGDAWKVFAFHYSL